MDAATGSTERTGERVPLDDLRRTLYRAGATEADVRRYLAEREARARPAPAAPAPPPRRRPSRRATLLALAAAIVALAGAAQLAQPVHAGRAIRPVALAQIGDGERVPVEEGAVAAPVDVATVVQGRSWRGRRFEGRGNAVVAVRAADRPGPGLVLVELESDAPSETTWRALVGPQVDGADRPAVVARGGAAAPSDGSDPATFEYRTRPPGRVAVLAPRGTRWTLLIATRIDVGATD